ncbi:MAG: DinB family protein [Acidobacteria bacterium]|nr:DinB family protein [Acidobacteriota bacterium]
MRSRLYIGEAEREAGGAVNEPESRLRDLSYMLERFRQWFGYDRWANQEVLTCFRAASHPPRRSQKLLGHILGTQYLWFSRIEQNQSPLSIWPELSLAECEQHMSRLEQIWSAYLARLDERGLIETITYQNSKGESWSNSVEEILTHVILHSAYHRGQIASDMRASGYTPAYTDFIHAVRQKFLK